MSEQHPDRPVGPPVAGWTPRPPARPALLEGRTVRLEALGEQHVDALWDALGVAGPDALWTYLPYGPFPSRDSLADHLRTLAADPGLAPLALVVDGRAGGYAAYMREDRTHGVVETGHVVVGVGLQRTTAATEAAYLMMRHALGDLGYRRYEWKCDALNAGSRRAALRFGFTFEGVFRQDKVVRGRSRDTAWFSVVDHEWPALRAAYDAWLAPANHDEQGRQRRPLEARTPGPDAGTPGTLS